VDNLGHAVAGQDVTISIDRAKPVTARTDGNGRFRRTMTVTGRGNRRALVAFAGTPLLADAQAEVGFFAGRRTINLSLTSSSKVSAGPPVSLRLLATSNGKPAKNVLLRTRLEDGRSVVRETGVDGRATLTRPPLPPGMHEVTVQVIENDVYRGLETKFSIESVQPTPAILRVTSPTPPPNDGPLSLEIRFGPTSESAPPARVTLTMNGQPEASQSRVEGGVAQFVVPRDDLPEGRHTFQGTVTPLVPGWADAVTPEISVDLPAPPPPSVAWQAVPLGLSLVALLALAARWRPTLKVMPPPPPAPVVPPVFEIVDTAEGGRLSLIVLDGLAGHRLAATVVSGTVAPAPDWDATPPDGPQLEATTDTPLDLPLDTHWVWCGAPGYAPVVHRLPPGGGRAAVRLLPPRAHVQRCFGDVLEPAGLPPLEFGRESPRDAGRALVTRGADERAVDALVNAVEAGCFGVNAPTDALIKVVESAANQVRDAFSRGAS